MPPVQAKAGQLLRVVLLGMGGEGDLHVPVFKGQVRSGGAEGGG